MKDFVGHRVKRKRWRGAGRLATALPILLFVITEVVSSEIAAQENGTLQTKTAVENFPPKPGPAPARWLGLIGEYGPDTNILYLLEKDGKLCVSFKRGQPECLQEVSKNSFRFPVSSSRVGQRLIVTRDRRGRATKVAVDKAVYQRRQIGPEEGTMQLRVAPVRPVAELLKEALAAQPPKESGEFLASDLVELIKLDPTIKLDIRYATTNNLFGSVFYSEPRAFLQRPAAEALVRINHRLRKIGYGLLVHDGYRPWYVTKVFWDATPQDKKLFVADPAQGSRHNRGAAVDLTLYDLKTGKAVEMVGTYDETTDRSYPDYRGGTSLQRWHRDLLRAMMEADGFTVYEAEWWHFDYNDWQKYPIGNELFEKLGSKVEIGVAEFQVGAERADTQSCLR
ncbi:MAG TPA: M15 family metallopeptidase [Pyrinomonadaceae bacterium]|nr:M15 family metallopeptidase [Pyrinomonadaceae bacterium]